MSDAEELAEQRGCNPINPCWDQCVEAALADIEDGEDRPHADHA